MGSSPSTFWGFVVNREVLESVAGELAGAYQIRASHSRTVMLSDGREHEGYCIALWSAAASVFQPRSPEVEFERFSMLPLTDGTVVGDTRYLGTIVNFVDRPERPFGFIALDEDVVDGDLYFSSDACVNAPVVILPGDRVECTVRRRASGEAWASTVAFVLVPRATGPPLASGVIATPHGGSEPTLLGEEFAAPPETPTSSGVFSQMEVEEGAGEGEGSAASDGMIYGPNDGGGVAGLISEDEEGTITRYGARGFGFIELEGSSLQCQVFFHVNNCEDPPLRIAPGGRVRCDVFERSDGSSYAMRVRFLGD